MLTNGESAERDSTADVEPRQAVTAPDIEKRQSARSRRVTVSEPAASAVAISDVARTSDIAPSHSGEPSDFEDLFAASNRPILQVVTRVHPPDGIESNQRHVLIRLIR
jgi:hypothetical protein